VGDDHVAWEISRGLSESRICRFRYVQMSLIRVVINLQVA